jgi:hypothetical protein
VELRTCRTCQVAKSLDEFYRYSQRPGVLFLDCKICHCDKNKARRKVNPQRLRTIEHRSHNLRTYGLTIERYEEMSLAQGGVCAICRGVNVDGKRLHVDHCHTTGVVRGLLCGRCNRGIGNFDDDSDRLMQAAYYLKGGQQ